MQHVHRLQPDDRGVGVDSIGVDQRRQPKEHVEGHQHREGRRSSEFVHRLLNAGDEPRTSSPSSVTTLVRSVNGVNRNAVSVGTGGGSTPLTDKRLVGQMRRR